MKNRFICLILTFVVLTGIVPVASAFGLQKSAYGLHEIILNTGIRQPFTTRDKSGFVDVMVREMFRRVGINAKVIVYQNSSKSLSNADMGIDDGVALRIKGLEKKYPNLVRVPEKIMDNDFVAYSIKKAIITDSWDSLRNAKIAHINGWQIFQNNLAGHPSIAMTKNAQQMFDLLSAGKVDFMLYERWQGLWRAQQMGVSIQVSEPPLAKREMFMYLHKKHLNVVEKVSTALSEMKKDGIYKMIFKATLGQLKN